MWGTRWRGWLTHFATNRKVAGSMGPLGFFIVIILQAPLWPWGRLSLYRKKSTRNISCGKGGLCLGLTTLPPSCAECLKSGSHNVLEPSGPVQRLLYLCFTSLCGTLYCYVHIASGNGKKVKVLTFNEGTDGG